MSKIGENGNIKDRKLGEYWEDVFIGMAKRHGWKAWPFNRKKGATFRDADGNTYISPDVWILKRGSKQYICEIKHKNLAKNGCYGFELYRESSMIAIEANYSNQFGGVEALYIVHNHDLAGGKWSKKNNSLHWHAQKLKLLAEMGHLGQPQHTYYGSELSKEPVPIKYYPYRYFRPIEYFLNLDRGQDGSLHRGRQAVDGHRYPHRF